IATAPGASAPSSAAAAGARSSRRSGRSPGGRSGVFLTRTPSEHPAQDHQGEASVGAEVARGETAGLLRQRVAPLHADALDWARPPPGEPGEHVDRTADPHREGDGEGLAALAAEVG